MTAKKLSAQLYSPCENAEGMAERGLVGFRSATLPVVGWIVFKRPRSNRGRFYVWHSARSRPRWEAV